jgi:ribosomal protein L11 methyltransferase
MADRYEPAPPRLLALSVPPPPPGEEILLVDALWRLGARSVERQAGRYLAVLPPPADLSVLLRDAELVIRASTSLRPPSLHWEWLERNAWAEEWSAALEPRRIGERFVVAPRDRVPDLAEGDRVIRLVPGVGFGTAEHATTRLCLRLLERHLRAGQQVADVGSGSGILAIAAVLLGAERVVAWERDAHACDEARENFAENGVAASVELREAEVGRETLRGEPPFDGIAANLPIPILVPLIPELAAALAADGWLILSGAPEAERRDVVDAAEAAGMRADDEVVEEGWWAGYLRRVR